MYLTIKFLMPTVTYIWQKTNGISGQITKSAYFETHFLLEIFFKQITF